MIVLRAGRFGPPPVRLDHAGRHQVQPGEELGDLGTA
jgi:hypothetical protein